MYETKLHHKNRTRVRNSGNRKYCCVLMKIATRRVAIFIRTQQYFHPLACQDTQVVGWQGAARVEFCQELLLVDDAELAV